MPALATAVPAAFRSGDTVAWALTLPDYDAGGGWTLTYTFVSTTQVKTLVAVGAGTTYTTSLAAVDSAAWAADDWAWQATIGNGTERYTVGTGRTTVLPSLVGAAAGFDSRGHARKVVDAIEAVIEGRASEAESDLQINGRAIKYIPVAELLALRDRYKLELTMGIAAGNFANTPRGMPDLRVRFTGS